jgi:hypothetical protein
MRRTPLAVLLLLAAVSVSPVALGVGVSPGAATPVQREQSQARFVRGKQFFDAKRYADALVEFQAAMEIVASPNARLYVARCLRETGKLVGAYVEFDRTAVEANEHAREDSRYARTGASARAERDAIAPKIGFLTARVDNATDGSRLRIAGEEIRQAGWNQPVPVMPGATEVVVETAPSAPIRQTVTVAAGEKKSVVIDATAPGPAAASATSPTDRTSLRPYAYVAGGVAAAGLLTFVIAGILSDTTYGALSSLCGEGPCPASKASEASRGQTEQTVADVTLGIGLVALAAGATLFVLSMPPKAKDEHSPEPATPSASAELSIAPGWLGVRGSF